MTALRWIGTLAQVIGVLMLSSRIVEPQIAFLVMLAGSYIWTYVALIEESGSLFVLNAVFTLSNVLGIIRWSA